MSYLIFYLYRLDSTLPKETLSVNADGQFGMLVGDDHTPATLLSEHRKGPSLADPHVFDHLWGHLSQLHLHYLLGEHLFCHHLLYDHLPGQHLLVLLVISQRSQSRRSLLEIHLGNPEQIFSLVTVIFV